MERPEYSSYQAQPEPVNHDHYSEGYLAALRKYMNPGQRKYDLRQESNKGCNDYCDSNRDAGGEEQGKKVLRVSVNAP